MLDINPFSSFCNEISNINSCTTYSATACNTNVSRAQKLYSVKSIKFDKKFTTVTWQDGTTTRVGCMLEDEYNRYEAFCAALAKKVYKSTSAVKHIVDTKDEQIEIDKQRKEREAIEKAAQMRKARKDRIWVKRRAKEIALENAAQELAKKISAK